MIKKYLLIIVLSIFFIGCASKTPIKTSSATIIFKTPAMKFYDKGFINKYENFIEVNILNLGKSVLYLKIYKDEICQNSFRCISSKEFNANYLNVNYNNDFLYNLFSKKYIYFKDKQNGVFIKVKHDKI